MNAVLAFTAYGLDTGSNENVQKVMNETFTLDEVKQARTILWEMCHDGYLPAIKNRQTSGRRSEQQAIVCDIVEWLTTLTDLNKRPCLVVDVLGLVRVPKFQVEEINEVAMCDKLTRLENQIHGMNTMILQHIEDSDNAMSRINSSLSQHTVDISIIKVKEDIPTAKPADNSSLANSSSSSQICQSTTAVSTAEHVVDSSPVISRSIDTLVGDDGKTYELPLRVNLPPATTSGDDITVSGIVSEGISKLSAAPEPSKDKGKTFSDALTKGNTDEFKLVSRKARVVYGKSSRGVLKAASESLFDACISGVDCVYTENDLVEFLKGHRIGFNSVKCYSKENSLSKTFKVTLPPRQYKRLFNPSLWDTGICVKRFFSQKKP